MLSVLSDGMGGLVRGEEAAIITVCKFVSRIIRKSQQSLPQRMIDAAQQANQAVFDRLGGKGGATLTVVCSSVDGPIGLNVGDSRIYGVDHGHPPVQLSKDDTLAGYLGSAAQGENRNHLVQYIGMGENLEPHIVEIPRRYSTALLSTDGAHGVQASAFSEAIQGAESQATIVRQLIALSDMVANGSRAQLNLRYPKGLRVRWHSKKPIISTGARQ
jgi:PPM family protein phosphatase